MTRPIDLGHALLQATGSLLQLRFSATANFTQVAIGASSSSSIKFSHWEDLKALWITEAPELKLRIFVVVDPATEAAGPTFAATLEEELCNSKVWTDLGFDIIHKNHTKVEISTAPGTHRLEFGLCRRDSLLAPVDTGRLPPILQNPPEAHVPSDVPTACLASIDLHLQYAYCNGVQQEAQIVETLRHKHEDETGLPYEFTSMQFTHSTGKFAVASFVLSTMEDSALSFDRPFNVGRSTYIEPAGQKTIMETIEQIYLQFLELFDFGLQKLILPGLIRNHHIKVVGKNKLQNLSVLAPAVFNPEYREAMKQRAASLSTISRSLMSMLENSSHPLIQSKLSATLRESTDPEGFLTSRTSRQDTQENTLTQSLESTIKSSLWGIAQHGLSKVKASKRSGSFFELDCLPGKSSIPTDDDIILPKPPEKELDPDSEMLGLDNDTNLPPILNTSRALEELLSEGSSMLSFGDLHDPTQTAQMTQTTQTSIESFPQPSECLPCNLDDLDILLSDEILMDEVYDAGVSFEEMDLS
ncbi:uncharacterized protein N7496_008048 [Penicillium cataractarum]|uniref:Uncharacterized protein n=1 Tax=Penicillium cataractarum TaxID=2100454 RepID=A0A9W9V466_9EURO|nr:uncharacterized protein N7496_008048 [Penicillium cataractarum]KAJ5368288.1 hypothetical protein N7496_008048 [Penicillium cataractarum]